MDGMVHAKAKQGNDAHGKEYRKRVWKHMTVHSVMRVCSDRIEQSGRFRTEVSRTGQAGTGSAPTSMGLKWVQLTNAACQTSNFPKRIVNAVQARVFEKSGGGRDRRCGAPACKTLGGPNTNWAWALHPPEQTGPVGPRKPVC